MSNSIYRVPPAVNEPISSFAPGTPERTSLQAKLVEMSAETVDIPIIIGGKEIRTGNTENCVMPHNHQHVLGSYHKAGEKEVQMAINSLNAIEDSEYKEALIALAHISIERTS